jgi:hypothetical protein
MKSQNFNINLNFLILKYLTILVGNSTRYTLYERVNLISNGYKII